MKASENAVLIRQLSFAYSGRPVFDRISVEVPCFSRCLVLGANGVGKSTLLRILAGKHLIAEGAVKILGADPFSGDLPPKTVAFVAEKFPFELDIEVRELVERANADPKLLKEVMQMLSVDPSWRMHRVSNGQRRRVDLMLSLGLKLPKLVLLDEVTSDLDILSRQRLLGWLKKQSQAKKMTVIFATHILDGMEQWASHLLFLSPGRVRAMEPMRTTLKRGPLLKTCEKWLLNDERSSYR